MSFRATSGTTIAETTFANIPSPVGSNGVIIRVSDVGPAPGILLISNNVIWRPLNGSAVLAQRAINPVTTQSTQAEGIVAETLGPFPGGLVRAGMRFEFYHEFSHLGVGSGNRVAFLYAASSKIAQFNAPVTSSSSSAWRVTLQVLADGSVQHLSTSNIAFGFGVVGWNSPSIDFSQDWSFDIHQMSFNETAVAITGATWAAGIATYTATAHTLATGDKTTVAGITPSGYNVVGVVTVLDANTFTIPIAGDPGAYSSGGTTSRISNMISQSYSLSLIG